MKIFKHLFSATFIVLILSSAVIAEAQAPAQCAGKDANGYYADGNNQSGSGSTQPAIKSLSCAIQLDNQFANAYLPARKRYYHSTVSTGI